MTTATALCATLLPTTGDLWFSTDPDDRAAAKRYCRACPLLAACADAGLADPTARGVWGGLSSGDRSRLCGRPLDVDPDDAADTAGAVPVLARTPAACGTERAYQIHRRYREDCARCQAAHDAHVHARRLDRLGEEHDRGGTATGAAIHRRLGEPPCARCLRAESAKTVAARAARRAVRARAGLLAVGAPVRSPERPSVDQGAAGAAA